MWSSSSVVRFICKQLCPKLSTHSQPFNMTGTSLAKGRGEKPKPEITLRSRQEHAEMRAMGERQH
eukprot:5121545-Pleurochrysis_carterae.AAC.1